MCKNFVPSFVRVKSLAAKQFGDKQPDYPLVHLQTSLSMMAMTMMKRATVVGLIEVVVVMMMMMVVVVVMMMVMVGLVVLMILMAVHSVFFVQ